MRARAAAVAVAVLAGCGGGAEAPDAATATTATTAGPPPSPADGEQSSATCGHAVAAGPVPRSAELVGAVDGDLDGDGRDDRFVVWAEGGQARARVELATGFAAEAPLDAVTDVEPVRPLGTHDVDGDGRAEAFAQVGSGASAAVVALFVLADCEVAQVNDGRQPFEWPVGGSVRHVSGLECGGPGGAALITATAESDDGTTYAWERTEHALEDFVLVEQGTTTGVYSLPEDDEALSRLGRLTGCGNATL